MATDNGEFIKKDTMETDSEIKDKECYLKTKIAKIAKVERTPEY